jgi:surfactin synthase thioesterase subunit
LAAFGGLLDEEVGESDLAEWRKHTAAEFSLRMLPGKHLFLDSDRNLLLDAIRQALTETFTRMAMR